MTKRNVLSRSKYTSRYDTDKPSSTGGGAVGVNFNQLCEHLITISLKNTRCKMSDQYMKNLTFENIAKACEGEYIGDDAPLSDRIKGAVIDSRLVEEGYLLYR